MLPAPGFHHLHLLSTDVEAAVAFYTRRFSGTARTTWAGLPAVHATTDVLLLFAAVDVPPKVADPDPQSAIWHFGWHVPDTRATMQRLLDDPEVTLLPLYTGVGGSVLISSDTWPGANGTLGRTVEEIAEAKSSGVQPVKSGGFGYIEGPDGAIVEYAGNQPAERFNHVHMYQDDPYCAQRWYEEHLNAGLVPGRSVALDPQADCVVPRPPALTFPALGRSGMYRLPASAVQFDDVAFYWYVRQGDEPLVSTRGYVYDHIALRVDDLDAWRDKLHAEGVRFIEDTHVLGDTRAFMVEGPSREAIELVEVRSR